MAGLRNAWSDLGNMQRVLLPVHMLKEFSREGQDTWQDTNAAFQVKDRPVPSAYWIQDFKTKGLRTLWSVILNQSCGLDSALVRGIFANKAFYTELLQEGVSDSAESPRVWSARDDAERFKRLFQVRKNDFEDHLSLLEKKLHKNPGPTNQVLPSASHR